MHTKTQGLVLREVAYKEADKILTVLTAEGGLRTVNARGCRRKGSRIAACTQLLTYSDMTLFDYRDHYSLNEAESIAQFWGVKGDVERLALGSYFAEVTAAVAEEGRADRELLSLILNSLYALDKLQKPQLLIKAAFELRLMCIAGYEPALGGCVACGETEPADARFHLSAGSLHCAGCRSEPGGISLPVHAPVLAAMRYLTSADPKRLFSFALDEAALVEFSDVCQAFLMTQLERGFRTLDFWNSLML